MVQDFQRSHLASNTTCMHSAQKVQKSVTSGSAPRITPKWAGQLTYAHAFMRIFHRTSPTTNANGCFFPCNKRPSTSSLAQRWLPYSLVTLVFCMYCKTSGTAESLFSVNQKRRWGACNLLTVVNLLCCAFFWTNCKTSSGAVRVFCSSGFFQNLFCCLKKVAVCGLFQCRLFLNRSEFWQTLLLWKHPMLHKWTVVLNMTYMETSTQLHIHACRSSG